MGMISYLWSADAQHSGDGIRNQRIAALLQNVWPPRENLLVQLPYDRRTNMPLDRNLTKFEKAVV